MCSWHFSTMRPLLPSDEIEVTKGPALVQAESPSASSAAAISFFILQSPIVQVHFSDNTDFVFLQFKKKVELKSRIAKFYILTVLFLQTRRNYEICKTGAADRAVADSGRADAG